MGPANWASRHTLHDILELAEPAFKRSPQCSCLVCLLTYSICLRDQDYLGGRGEIAATSSTAIDTNTSESNNGNNNDNNNNRLVVARFFAL